MMRFQHLSVSKVHVHTTRQARIETPQGAHDVYTLEFVRPVFLEDRRVLYRIFVGSRRSIDVARIRVPRRWWVWMVICDFAVANHDVVRQHAAHSFVESATDSVLRHLELRPG